MIFMAQDDKLPVYIMLFSRLFKAKLAKFNFSRSCKQLSKFNAFPGSV